MHKRKLIVAWIMAIMLAVATSGCSLLSAAISAGITYGIYKATSK